MNFIEILQEVAMYKESLASCAIEGNQFAQKQSKVIKDMDLIEQYDYLKKTFDNLKSK
jgi:hypothetical protein